MSVLQILSLLGVVVDLYFLWKGKRVNEELTTEAAIAHLLEKEVVVEYRGHHLYKTKRSNKPGYSVLSFDMKGNLMQGHDQDFTEAKDAIAEFMKRTQLA